MLNDLIHLFYTDHCFGCNDILLKGENNLCAACKLQLPRIYTEENPYQRLIFQHQYQQIAAAFYFTKNSRIQQILHAIKYRGQKELAYFMGVQMASVINTPDIPELIIPVPLHPARLRRRGYNQSEEIAKGLAHEWSVSIDSKTLARKVNNQSLTKKGRLDRLDSMDEVFYMKERPHLPDHIAILDDVITTGATLDACLSVMRQFYQGKVTILSLALSVKA